jgi:hypothetical protein
LKPVKSENGPGGYILAWVSQFLPGNQTILIVRQTTRISALGDWRKNLSALLLLLELANGAAAG